MSDNEAYVTIRVRLDRTDPDRPRPCAPPGTHGTAAVETSFGRSPPTAWAQFAVPYHALVRVPETSVHDCRYHRPDEDAVRLTDAEEYRAFAGRVLPQRMRALVRRGLADADRGLLF